MTLGQKIKELRKKKNIPVPTLSDKLKVERTSIYAWEADRVRPRSEKLEEIAQLFEISVKELSELSVTKSQPFESSGWLEKRIEVLESTNKQLMIQLDRLTRILENAHLGKLADCPHSTIDVPVFSLYKNEEPVEESVNIEPFKKRA